MESEASLGASAVAVDHLADVAELPGTLEPSATAQARKNGLYLVWNWPCWRTSPSRVKICH
jgi:hypothetical protein